MVDEAPHFPESAFHFAGDVQACDTRLNVPTGVAEAAAGVQRASLESFIAARFAQAHGARVAHYCRHLVGLRAASGGWRAAVGYTGAHEGSLFLEHYLDVSIEHAIAQAMRQPVRRDEVVEVGNLASRTPGAAREMIGAMRAHLRRAGFEWVTFTATRELRNTFVRLGLDLHVLCAADPRRVPGGGAGWGRYYSHDPVIVFGRLAGVTRAIA